MKLAAMLSVLVGSLLVAGSSRAETVFFRVTRDKSDEPLKNP